jgi:hypothetical protein
MVNTPPAAPPIKPMGWLARFCTSASAAILRLGHVVIPALGVPRWPR